MIAETTNTKPRIVHERRNLEREDARAKEELLRAHEKAQSVSFMALADRCAADGGHYIEAIPLSAGRAGNRWCRHCHWRAPDWSQIGQAAPSVPAP